MNSDKSTRVLKAIISDNAAISISAVGRPNAMVAMIAVKVTGMTSARNGSFDATTAKMMQDVERAKSRNSFHVSLISELSSD